MTLNGRSGTLAEMKLFYGAHQKNFNEDRHIISSNVGLYYISGAFLVKIRDGSISDFFRNRYAIDILTNNIGDTDILAIFSIFSLYMSPIFTFRQLMK